LVAGQVVHKSAACLTLATRRVETVAMIDALRLEIARGDYRVDPNAVAAAMIARAQALRAACRRAYGSEMLVAADEIEIRCLAPDEANARPLEGAA
jgi:hypothetical protein